MSYEDKIHRSAVTGKFVEKEYALEHPDTTVSEPREVYHGQREKCFVCGRVIEAEVEHGGDDIQAATKVVWRHVTKGYSHDDTRPA